jgi:hypothetical protein
LEIIGVQGFKKLDGTVKERVGYFNIIIHNQ